MFSSIVLTKINDKVFVNQVLIMVLTADIMDLLGKQKGLLVRWLFESIFTVAL